MREFTLNVDSALNADSPFSAMAKFMRTEIHLFTTLPTKLYRSCFMTDAPPKYLKQRNNDQRRSCNNGLETEREIEPLFLTPLLLIISDGETSL
jgi:hypothetical protein